MFNFSAPFHGTAKTEKQYSEYVLPPPPHPRLSPVSFPFPPPLLLPFPPLPLPLPLLLQYIYVYLSNFDHVLGKQVTPRHVFHDLITWALERLKISSYMVLITSLGHRSVWKQVFSKKQVHVFSVHTRLLLLHCT